MKSFFYLIIEKRTTKEKMLGGLLVRTSNIALTVSLKLCQNLCSFKWLKPKCSLVSNVIPIGSCIEQHLTSLKFSSSDLIYLRIQLF